MLGFILLVKVSPFRIIYLCDMENMDNSSRVIPSPVSALLENTSTILKNQTSLEVRIYIFGFLLNQKIIDRMLAQQKILTWVILFPPSPRSS